MWTRNPQLTGRADRWRQDTCGRDTPTDSRAPPCSHVETHARILLMRTVAHPTADLSTFYSESYSIQQQMQWQKKDSEHCRPWGKQSVNHKRSFILKRRRQKERERQRGRTERFVTAPGCPFNVTLTHRLPKLLLYLRVPFHSTMYTCMYICTCTVSKYNQHIQAISKSNSRYVTALRRCWVSEKWAAMSPVRAGEVWKQVTDRRFFSHKGHMRTFWLQAFFGVTH